MLILISVEKHNKSTTQIKTESTVTCRKHLNHGKPG